MALGNALQVFDLQPFQGRGDRIDGQPRRLERDDPKDRLDVIGSQVVAPTLSSSAVAAAGKSVKNIPANEMAGGCAIAKGSAAKRTSSGILMSGISAGRGDTFSPL